MLNEIYLFIYGSNSEILLGALIAGLIGFLTQFIHTRREEKRSLENIKECLNDEWLLIITMLKKKMKNLEDFTRPNDSSKAYLEIKIDDIIPELDGMYVKASLTNAIYSNNNIFNMKRDELRKIYQMQILVENYNHYLKTYVRNYNNGSKRLYDNIQKLTKQDKHISQNSSSIVFFFQYVELTEKFIEDLVKLQL